MNDLNVTSTRTTTFTGEPAPSGPAQKRNVLIFSNSGGGGHKSAGEAIKRGLGGQYNVAIDYSYDQIEGSEYFNETMKKSAYRTLGLITKAQGLAEKIIVPTITPIVAKKIYDFKPDLIISVFPVANNETWELAKAAGIPMLVLVTDLYCKHFFNNMDHPGENFKIGLPFDDKWIKDQLLPQFDEDNFVTTGFPLRPDFGLTPKEMEPMKLQIQKELGIKEEDKIVVVMMGAQGGSAIAEISQLIANNPEQYPHNVHVVALCSSNKEIQDQTNEACKDPQNPKVKIHALDKKEGDYIATLMRMSNVLISKPGGATVNEAIASQLYTLYEQKGNDALPWEKGNMEFSQSHGWGEPINQKTLVQQVNNALNKPKFKVHNCPGRDFDANIQREVRKILGSDTLPRKNYNALTNTIQNGMYADTVMQFGKGVAGAALGLAKEKIKDYDHSVLGKAEKTLRLVGENTLGDEDYKNEVIETIESSERPENRYTEGFLTFTNILNNATQMVPLVDKETKTTVSNNISMVSGLFDATLKGLSTVATTAEKTGSLLSEKKKEKGTKKLGKTLLGAGKKLKEGLESKQPKEKKEKKEKKSKS